MIASSLKIPPWTGYGLSTLGLDDVTESSLHRGTIDLLRVDVQHATSTTKALVPAPKIYGSNPILPQHGSAHDAGLYRDIEVGLLERADWKRAQDAG